MKTTIFSWGIVPLFSFLLLASCSTKSEDVKPTPATGPENIVFTDQVSSDTNQDQMITLEDDINTDGVVDDLDAQILNVLSGLAADYDSILSELEIYIDLT